MSKKPDNKTNDKERAADLVLWRALLSDVTPLHAPSRRLAPHDEQPAKKSGGHAAKPKPVWQPLQRTPVPDADPLRLTRKRDPFPELQRREKKHIAKGQQRIEATLDLHGLYQDAAHRAVTRFIIDAQRRGCKTVLVITGKGQGKTGGGNEGVLKKSLLHWLAADAALSACIQSVSPASPGHGGEGAFYVMLRRKKPV